MLRDRCRVREISLIDFPLPRCSRRIQPIVSTISIPYRPLRAKAGRRPNRKSGGQFCTPMTPLRGSILHAETHPVVALEVRPHALQRYLGRLCDRPQPTISSAPQCARPRRATLRSPGVANTSRAILDALRPSPSPIDGSASGQVSAAAQRPHQIAWHALRVRRAQEQSARRLAAPSPKASWQTQPGLSPNPPPPRRRLGLYHLSRRSRNQTGICAKNPPRLSGQFWMIRQFTSARNVPAKAGADDRNPMGSSHYGCDILTKNSFRDHGNLRRKRQEPDDKRLTTANPIRALSDILFFHNEMHMTDIATSAAKECATSPLPLAHCAAYIRPECDFAKAVLDGDGGSFRAFRSPLSQAIDEAARRAVDDPDAKAQSDRDLDAGAFRPPDPDRPLDPWPARRRARSSGGSADLPR